MNKLGQVLAPALLMLALALPVAAAEPITVSGRVVGPGDVPIAGAEVALTALEGQLERGRRWLAQEADPPPLATARTDAEGRFKLAVAEPLFALATVRAPGFAASEVPLEPLLATIELPTARLARSRELTVRVTGAGKPWPGAWVAVSALGEDARFASAGWRGARRWGRAGADGLLRVQRGEDEAVLVRAFAPGGGEAERESVRGSTVALELPPAAPVAVQLRGAQGQPVAGAVLFGGKGAWPLAQSDPAGKLAAPSTLAATTFTVRAAEGVVLETRLPPEKGDGSPRLLDLPAAIRIAGRVLEVSNRRPLAGALIWPVGAGELAVRSRGDGVYEMHPPGTRPRLRAAAAGFLPADAELPRNSSRGPTFVLAAAVAVRGTVVDESGRPVAGAEIVTSVNPQVRMGRPNILPNQSLRARTGAEGSFELAGLDTDTAYGLSVSHAGYAPASVDLPPAGPAAPRPPQRIVLTRGVSAHGRVLDGRRQPVAGAAVELTRIRTHALSGIRILGMGSAAPEFTATSGADGRFEIAHLPIDRYDLEVEARGFAPLTVPGLELTAAVPRRDLGTIVVGPGAVLEGVTVDAAGAPLADARVWAFAMGSSAAMTASFRGPGDEPDAVSAADGRFRIEDLRPGEPVQVVALRHGYARGQAGGVEPPLAEPLRIVLAPSSRVSGRVLGLDGKGIPGANVGYILKRVLGSRGSFTRGAMSATSGGEGRFTLEGVEPGTVMLQVSAPGFVPANRDDVQVGAGQDVGGVEVLLRAAARIAGQILDAAGQPAAAVMVALSENEVVLAMSRMGQARAISDGDGYYTLDGVEPGPRTVRADDSAGRRAVAELEVRPGDNALDLRLAGGVEVSGRVVDTEGRPLGGANLLLEAGPGFRPERSAQSLADGSFLLSDVGDGAYQLSAQRAGFAPNRIPVEVAGSSLGGLELRLGRGGAIVGRVIGLSLAELPRLRLAAWHQGQRPYPGQVDFDGRYRIADLEPGDLTVMAELSGGGRSAGGKVTLAEGQAEATLDLEFGQGWVLTGRVSSAGQPVTGATIAVHGRDVAANGETSTGQAGEFKIQDLKSGLYDLTVYTEAGGLAHASELSLSEDREIEIAIATGSVVGVVVDAVDRAPIAGAVVTLQPPTGTETRHRLGRARSTSTDSRGLFVLDGVAEGEWTVTAERGGYARAERGVVVGAGADREEIELQLQPTEGVILEVHSAGGRVPQVVFVSVGDGAGRAVAGGLYSPADTGRLRLSDVPAGAWELLLSADDSAVAQLPVVAPGPVVPVVLAPGAIVEIVVPDLAESALFANATLVDAAGRPFRVPEWGGGTRSEFLVRAGRVRLQNLPAGVWRVTVVAPDGQTWSGTATAAPGAPSELRLDSPPAE